MPLGLILESILSFTENNFVYFLRRMENFWIKKKKQCILLLNLKVRTVSYGTLYQVMCWNFTIPCYIKRFWFVSLMYEIVHVLCTRIYPHIINKYQEYRNRKSLHTGWKYSECGKMSIFLFLPKWTFGKIDCKWKKFEPKATRNLYRTDCVESALSIYFAKCYDDIFLKTWITFCLRCHISLINC